jgi:hypothetical protein
MIFYFQILKFFMAIDASLFPHAVQTDETYNKKMPQKIKFLIWFRKLLSIGAFCYRMGRTKSSNTSRHT